MMRTMVLGFGNDVLGDDAIGLHVAAAVGGLLAVPAATCSIFGLDVPVLLEDHDAAIIIDALERPIGAVGEVWRFSLEEFYGCRHLCSPHCTDFSGGIAFARAAGLAMPECIVIYGVVIRPVAEFCEQLSQELHARLPAITDCIAGDAAKLLPRWQTGERPLLTGRCD